MTTLPPDQAPASRNEPHTARRMAESFGVDAERYDRTRPPYPDEMVARVVAAAPGPDVLDVGCGTGILAICALKLGAEAALCIDVDPDAVEVTRENAALNDVAAHVQASTEPVENLSGSYPLVLANIQASVLIPLAEAISARVAPGGLLMLSGILVGQEDEVRAAYPGFTEVAAPVEGEWIALVLKKRA